MVMFPKGEISLHLNLGIFYFYVINKRLETTVC